jgi:multiple sugar transport system permease protein
MRGRGRKERRRWLLTAIGSVVSAVILFPFFVMAMTALKTSAQVYALPATWLPPHWDFQNFVAIWSQVPLARYLLNSTIVAGGATLLAVVCAIPAGYVLGRHQFRGKRSVIYGVLITQMFPPIVLLVGLFQEILSLGLMNTLWALVLVNAAFNQAFAVWMLAGYFSTIDPEIDDSAAIDGASRMTTLVRVLLPLAAPGVVTAVIFVFIAAWNEFATALTVISSANLLPVSVGIFNFIGEFNIQWQYLCAASLVATVPVVALFLLIQRHITSGLTAGAIK